MRLLSWNVCFQILPGQKENVLSAIGSAKADIVALQEIPSALADEVRGRLARLGLEHSYDSADSAPGGPSGLKSKSYQCLVASRWPVAASGNQWRKRAPYPEMLGRATVSAPQAPIDLFNVHIPNGSGNGWRKIDSFQRLSAALREADDAPRILTGDFNEPREFRRSGQIVTFEEKLLAGGGTTSPSHMRDLFGVTRPGVEWTCGVRSVLAGASQHGLRDAWRDTHGWESTPVTHRTTANNPRCFDHTLVSRHFEILDCGYFHEWRLKGWSDHSAMWTDLRLSLEPAPLVEWDDEEQKLAS